MIKLKPLFTSHKIILAYLSFVFLLLGCREIPQEKQIHGTFTKGFEVFEIQHNSQTLFVSDPNHLLDSIIKLEHKKQNSPLWISFDICLKGNLQTGKHYGPTGKYDAMIEVKILCEK